MNPRYNENPPLGRDKWGRCICNTSMNKDEPKHDNKICMCECHFDNFTQQTFQKVDE